MKEREVDPQRLGALLDGRLPTRERHELLAELAASDDAIDLLSDVAAVLRAVEEPAATPGDATPIDAARYAARRRRPAYVRWLAVAASIAVLVSVPTLLMRSRDRGAAVTSGAAGRPTETLPDGWDGTPWRATRGAGDPLTADARAVRVGARLADLERLARTGDARTTEVVAEVAALFHDVPGGALGVAALDALRAGTTDARPATAERMAAVREAADALFGRELTALGAWLESARLAAVRRDAAFFRTDESRAALGSGRGSGVVRPLAPASAAQVTRHLDGSGGPDWERLQAELTTILRTLGS